MSKISHFITVVVAGAGVLAATQAAAQTYEQTFAKSGNGGLLLNNMELKRSPKGKVAEAVAMNGYQLIFQNDSNICVQKQPTTHVWCVNDMIGDKYKQITKVKFEKGTLIAYDAKGAKLWSTRPVSDPHAKIIITPQGKLTTMSSVGSVYWQK